MNENNENYLGSFRYCGKLVEDGLLDARKSAQALLGLDEAIRFFVGCQNPKLHKMNFELPVKVRQGSWEALIPDAMILLKTVLLTGSAAYSVKAAQKMAENDFSEIGIKTIFTKSLEAIQWIIRIGKHVGTIQLNKFERVKFRKNNTQIGIPNKKGEYLWVPKYYLDLYSKSPKTILSKVAGLVEEERILLISVKKDNEEITEKITPKYKSIFTKEGDDEILFPELIHGMEVVLEGEVTRGNETTNSIGFRYNDHILTAYPETGSIVTYKATLFLKATIEGVIDRTDEKGKIKAKRPKIIFRNIITENSPISQMPLFRDDS